MNAMDNSAPSWSSVFWLSVYLDWEVREDAEEIMLESTRRMCAPKGNDGITNGRADDMSEVEFRRIICEMEMDSTYFCSLHFSLLLISRSGLLQA
jgi:hypothetical protein